MLHSYLTNLSLPDKAKKDAKVQRMLDSHGLQGTTASLFEARTGIEGVRYALSSENSEVIQSLADHAIDHCRSSYADRKRKTYWMQTTVIMPLLQTLGEQKDDMSKAVTFAYESISVLEPRPRSPSNHGVANLYLFVDDTDSAIRINLEDGQPIDARRIADSFLEGEDKRLAYQKIIDAIPRLTPHAYHRGLEIKINLASDLGLDSVVQTAREELDAYLIEHPVRLEPCLPDVSKHGSRFPFGFW